MFTWGWKPYQRRYYEEKKVSSTDQCNKMTLLLTGALFFALIIDVVKVWFSHSNFYVLLRFYQTNELWGRECTCVSQLSLSLRYGTHNELWQTNDWSWKIIWRKRRHEEGLAKILKALFQNASSFTNLRCMALCVISVKPYNLLTVLWCLFIFIFSFSFILFHRVYFSSMMISTRLLETRSGSSKASFQSHARRWKEVMQFRYDRTFWDGW